MQTQETLVRSLGLEDLLKEGMAKHSSILTWTIPCTEKLSGLQSRGSHRNMTEATEHSIAHFRVLGKTYCLISGEVSSSSELVLNTILPTVSQPPTARPPSVPGLLKYFASEDRWSLKRSAVDIPWWGSR